MFAQPTHFYISSPSQNGVMTQMGGGGIMNAVQNSMPTMSFWRFRFLQYTPFALVDVTQNVDGVPQFGGNTRTKLAKVGDLLYFLYAMYQVPGIVACNQPLGQCGPAMRYPTPNNPATSCAVRDTAIFNAYGGAAGYMQNVYGCAGEFECLAGCDTAPDTTPETPWVHYTNAIAQFLTVYATITVATADVDTVTNVYMYASEELCGKPGKYLAEMVGKWYCRDELIEKSACTTTYYCPLPFYFTQAPGNALPLTSVAYVGAFLTLQFANLEDCVVVSGEGVIPVKWDGSGPLQNTDLKVGIQSLQVVLENAERERFVYARFEQLITQVKTQILPVSQSTQNFQLMTNGSVIEIIWCVRRKCAEEVNNWFNFSGVAGKDPITSAAISIQTTLRQPWREAGFYRMIQPYQYHSRMPEGYVYCFSFALLPEEPQPSSFFCLARTEPMYLCLNFQPGLAVTELTLFMFVRVWNILQFGNGGAFVVLRE